MTKYRCGWRGAIWNKESPDIVLFYRSTSLCVMKYTHSLFVFFLVLIPLCSFAQEQKQMSDPLDMKPVGWNKVLCMKNGNTLLFHFEPNKPLIVYVFDSSHRLVATQKQNLRLFDVTVLKTSLLKGLFEVNEEAVLFIDQEHLGKHELVCARFNGTDGELIMEKQAGDSHSTALPTNFYVMKSATDDGYEILFATDNVPFRKCDLHVSYYNNKYEATRDVTIPVSRDEYDLLTITGADCSAAGTCITACLKQQSDNSTQHEKFREADRGNTYTHFLFTFFIPINSNTVRTGSYNLGANIFPYYTGFTYNPFVGTLNMLMFSYIPVTFKVGLERQPGAVMASLFLNFDTVSMVAKNNWLHHQLANASMHIQARYAKSFEGVPVKMFTNVYGLTTIVSESLAQHKEIEKQGLVGHENYLGNICITQLDDEGKEIWGTVLPKSQYYKGYYEYYEPYRESGSLQFTDLFGPEEPEQVYSRQFVGTNSYTCNRDYYVIYNDKDKNFSNSIKDPGDTVYDFSRTNACYYKLGKGKVVTKHYVFGTPAENEYKCSFIEGADFDAKRGVYAALVQYKKNEEVSLRMAWSHLE